MKGGEFLIQDNIDKYHPICKPNFSRPELPS